MKESLFKTELECLITCRNHWQFMWITGSPDKYDYGPANKWDNKCACCEYAKEIFNFNRPLKGNCCKFCPLTGYAWKSGCSYNKRSFYDNWCEAKTHEQRQFWANRMVYACNQAIENYLLNKKEG